MRLFVGNLAFSTTDKEIMAHFQSQGFKPVAIKLVTDRETGRSRGFCFVDLPSDIEGNNAIQSLNGSELSGRRLKITPAEDKRKGSPTSREVSLDQQKKPYISTNTHQPRPQESYNKYPEEVITYNDPSYYQALECQEVGKERSRRKDPSRKKNRREREEYDDEDW